jgi:murein DD-endopeptidase MepM/ murein hydrolase activator NlpD
MTVLAKIYGIFADFFVPIIMLFAGVFRPEPVHKKSTLIGRAATSLAPVGAIVFTVLTILNISAYKPELELWINDEYIGLVSSRSVALSASNRFEANISTILGESFEFTGTINHKLVLVKDPVYITESDVNNRLHGYSQNYIMSAFGLYIDGELVGVTTNRSYIDETLNQIREEGTDKDLDDKVEIDNEIEIRREDFAVRDVLTGDEFMNIVTFSAFAAADDISPDTGGNTGIPIKGGGGGGMAASDESDETENNFEDEDENGGIGGIDPMTEGGVDIAAAAAVMSLSDEAVSTLPRGGLNSLAEANDNSILTRLSRSSASASVASGIQLRKTRTEDYIVDIPFETRRIESNLHFVGTEIVQSSGANGTKRVFAEISLVGESEISRELTDGEVITPPVDRVILVGTKVRPATTPTGRFIRPIRGGTNTSRFSASHRALDIAAPFGTVISASDGGTVLSVGFEGSYGNCIRIRHSNGYVTLYAHLSSFSVSRGTQVYQGQEIGRVGSTGRSTGNHVHFEIIRNGVQVNPQNYIN